MRSLQGHLLVATPSLLDANFFQTVVLMIQHSDEGAFGVVLNRPSRNTISEIWSQVCGVPSDCEEPVYHGGPVSGPLLAVHTLIHLSDVKVMSGLYCSMDRDKIEQIVLQENEPFRFFVGSAGWAPGQLENEIREGSWLVLPATVDHILHGDRSLWSTAIKEFGESLLCKAYGVSEVPDDPRVN